MIIYQKIVQLLRESADRIEKINKSKELRNSDKTLAAQVIITKAQLHASRMSPLIQSTGSERPGTPMMNGVV